MIFAAIVIAWAGYLVPTALRRHDQASKARSIDRFSSAMRVLARRTTLSGGRVVVAPPRSGSRLLGPEPIEEPEPETVRVRPSREALRAAAARRRRVLAGLASLTLIVLVVAVAGVLPLWSVVLPLVAIAGFLVVARRSVRRASEDYWVEVEARPADATNVVRRAATRVEAAAGNPSDGDADKEPTVGLAREELAAAVLASAPAEPERMVAVTVKTADGGSLWDPLPVTLPSYVDAPAAKRTMRTIDLSGPDTWSSGREPEPANAPQQADAVAETAPVAGVADAGSEAAEPAEEPAQAVNG